MKFFLTHHAVRQGERRGISKELVEKILDSPQHVVNSYDGTRILPSQVDFPNGRKYLVRVVVDIDREPNKVLTVYRTSKISKYWEQK